MLSSELLRKLAFTLCVFFLPIEVWGEVPVKSVEIRLEPEVAVSGGSVVLGDVATIYAKRIQDFQALSTLTISRFPGDQSVMRLPQAYLMNRIREALPPGTEFKLHAPQQVVFRLERLGISPQELANELIRRGRAEGKIPEWAEVEMQPVSGFEQLSLLKIADAVIEPSAEMNRWRGDLTFKVGRSGKSTESPGWVRVKMRWFAEAWVARKQIGILTILQPEDFVKSRVEVTALREDPILSSDDLPTAISNARARRGIQASSPLTVAAIEKAPDAKPGQSLKVIFVSESGIRVTAEGSLVGSGSIGNEVRARLRTSKKTVTGRLVSGGAMEVTL